MKRAADSSFLDRRLVQKPKPAPRRNEIEVQQLPPMALPDRAQYAQWEAQGVNFYNPYNVQRVPIRERPTYDDPRAYNPNIVRMFQANPPFHREQSVANIRNLPRNYQYRGDIYGGHHRADRDHQARRMVYHVNRQSGRARRNLDIDVFFVWIVDWAIDNNINPDFVQDHDLNIVINENIPFNEGMLHYNDANPRAYLMEVLLNSPLFTEVHGALHLNEYGAELFRQQYLEETYN